jgi:hypothetical protein
MTYFRREHHPVDGHADVPDRIWQEFQRVRSALMGIDQNNVLADGVDRDTIVAPDDSDHEGCSDVLAQDGLIATNVSSGTQTLTQAPDDGVWQSDTLTEIDILARSESWWIVAISAEWSWTAPAAGRAATDLQISSSSAGTARGVSHGFLGHDGTPADGNDGPACSHGQVALFRVPAGRCVFRPNYRARWTTGTTADVLYKNRFMFAVGFYQT